LVENYKPFRNCPTALKLKIHNSQQVLEGKLQRFKVNQVIFTGRKPIKLTHKPLCIQLGHLVIFFVLLRLDLREQ
jgi:hypothetical protein